MKVELVNGSPHQKGCTNRALEEVASALEEDGVDAHIFWLGSKPVGGCTACGGCATRGRCVFADAVNEFRPLARKADGFVFGAPVHFAHAGSSLLGFMDRLFFSDERAEGGPSFDHKPAAAVVSARRAGTTASFDDVNKFFTIRQMPVVSATYWNMVHGYTPEDVERDEEGLGIMRQLGHNMAWLLKCIEAGEAEGSEAPARPVYKQTNFIR